MIYKITSKENKIIKYTLKLKESKYIKKEKKFIIEGEHLLEMAINNGLEYVICDKELNLSDDINQYIVTEDILKKISSNKSFSHIIGVCKIKENAKIDGDLILYLDNLQDPGNIGTILRTALAFNVKTIISNSIIPFYNQKTIQASQGAIFYLNLIPEDFKILSVLKGDYTLVGTALRGNTILLNDFRKPSKMILVVGNEGKGVSKDILDICDYTIKIDIANIESLNVAIATAICLYHLRNNY